MESVFDVVVVGAGPGGSAVATLLSRDGASTLILDKALFPRDKVCGDGLTPRALYWLNELGCVDEVLDSTRSCITAADLYVRGKHVLTGAFPASGPYPGFCVILKRKELDHIMVRNAVAAGARFRPGCMVRGLRWTPAGVVVEAQSESRPVSFLAKIVIGADGANSMVSRALGNQIRDGVTAVSMRGYYEGVRTAGANIQVHFDEAYFPGYGWVFADDDGHANVGVGCAVDPDFPLRDGMRKIYDRFVSQALAETLRGAVALGEPKGGFSSFFRPSKTVADGVLLIGDAANLADPISGGGIHMAMESAHVAAPVALEALRRNDCSAAFLAGYRYAWDRGYEADWRAGELMLTIAKNPQLRELWLYGLEVIAGVARNDARFQEYCAGMFSGGTAPSSVFDPSAWFHVIPWDPQVWRSAFPSALGAPEAAAAARRVLRAAREMAASPATQLGWGIEVFAKILTLAGRYLDLQFPAVAGDAVQ